MTRRGFHILLALILVGCVLSPYVEFATGWGQSIFDTGHDTESIVAIIALLLILAFALATLLINFPAGVTTKERLAAPILRLKPPLVFISIVPEISPPPLPLRI